MNNKNKIVNLAYQLATIIIELMLLLLLNIYIYKNESNNWYNYNKIITLG